MLGVILLIKLWLVGWRNGLFKDLCPVYAFEPGVALNLLCISSTASQTLIRVFMKELCAYVSRIWGQEFVVKLGLCIFDVFVKYIKDTLPKVSVIRTLQLTYFGEINSRYIMVNY